MTEPINQTVRTQQSEWSRAGLIFRCGKCHSENQSRVLRFHMLKMVLGDRKLRIASMTDPNDNRFPYVPLCSTFGTIVSLASVWLETCHAFAPVVGA
jgi:hypothetical protein